MIKVAVCDDETHIREKLTSIIKAYFCEQKRAVWVASYPSGLGLLKANIQFDIIFLDIEMPDMNGIETAEKLRCWDVSSKIIYVTNYEKYKSCVYKVHIFDYICKPVQENVICEVLSEAVRCLDHALEQQKYAFMTQEGIITLEPDDIYYFEYQSRKVVINSSQGKYIAAYSLKELYEKFSKYHFESSHKSFILNLIHIKSIKGFDIYMKNGDVVPLAQKRAVDFKKRFHDFLQSAFVEI